MRKFVVCVSALVLLSVPRAGEAQGFISPFIGYNFGGDAGCPEISGCEDRNLNVGVSVGTMGRIFAFEEEFAYAKDFFGESPGVSSNVLTLMSNVMIAPAIGPVRPYFLVGAGLMKTHVELTAASLLDVSNNSFGWDIGGGVMGFFGDHVGIRGEIRYFHSFKDLEILGIALPNTPLDFGRASAGLVLKF